MNHETREIVIALAVVVMLVDIVAMWRDRKAKEKAEKTVRGVFGAVGAIGAGKYYLGAGAAAPAAKGPAAPAPAPAPAPATGPGKYTITNPAGSFCLNVDGAGLYAEPCAGGRAPSTWELTYDGLLATTAADGTRRCLTGPATMSGTEVSAGVCDDTYSGDAWSVSGTETPGEFELHNTTAASCLATTSKASGCPAGGTCYNTGLAACGPAARWKFAPQKQ